MNATETTNTTLPLARATVDLFESEDSFLLVAEVPGVRADGVELDVEQGLLTLTATPAGAVADAPSRRELREVRWTRRLRLPDGVDPESIQAELNQGVLQVTLPKTQALRRRRIPIAEA